MPRGTEHLGPRALLHESPLPEYGDSIREHIHHTPSRREQRTGEVRCADQRYTSVAAQSPALGLHANQIDLHLRVLLGFGCGVKPLHRAEQVTLLSQ